MNKLTHLLYWSLNLAIVFSLTMVVIKTIELIKINQLNDFIENVDNYEDTPNTAKTLFARAYYQVENDQEQAALDTLTHAIARHDQHTDVSALMNRANINLRQALALAPDDKKRIPVAELAKQDYRKALQLNPQQWDVRYNLEVALRVVPERPEEDVLFEKPSVQRQRTVESKAFKVDLP